MNKNTFKKGNNNNYEKEVDSTSKKRNRSTSKKEIKTVYEKDTKELEKVLKNKSKSDFDLNEFFEEEEIAHRDYFTYIYVKEPKDAALIYAFNKDSSTRDLDELNEYMRECGFETFD